MMVQIGLSLVALWLPPPEDGTTVPSWGRIEARHRQEEAAPRPLQAPDPQEGRGRSAFIDWAFLELSPRFGLAMFSEDYDVDPSFAGGILARAPMPWLSPSSDPEGDYFGLFAEIDMTSIERDITPELEDPDGIAMLFTVGVDYTFVRNGTWLLLAQAGVTYAYHGGITDLSDGPGPMVGLMAGVNLSRQLCLTVDPQVAFGEAGDRIYLLQFGIAIDF